MFFEGGREPFGWRTKGSLPPSSSPHPSQTRFTMEDDGWLPVARLPLLMVPRKNVEPGRCWSGFLFFSLFFFPSSFSFAGSIRWTGGHKKGQPYGCPFLWLWGKRMGKRSDRCRSVYPFVVDVTGCKSATAPGRGLSCEEEGYPLPP